MRYPSSRKMSNKAAVPLRPDAQGDEFTSLQNRIFGAFIACIIAAGKGAYVGSLRGGSAIRIRVYDGEESYEDTLTPRDDLAELLMSYAKQFDAEAIFRGQLAALLREPSQPAGEVPASGGPPSQPAKALRGPVIKS